MTVLSQSPLSAQSDSRTESRSARVVLLGLGAINRRVVGLLFSRQSGASVVGVIRRHPESISREEMPWAVPIKDPADLVSIAPDIVLEAASSEAVREWGDIALSVARRFVVSSSSAFVDHELLCRLRETARRHGSQLVVSPGALAGIDALAAAARLGIHEVRHRIIEPPSSWATHANQAMAGVSSERVILFRGSAREAARQFPLNANVTIVSALSAIGLDRTIVELVADPATDSNSHEIYASGDFGSLVVKMENRPLASNPKSSELAALALLRLVENEVTEFVI
jgi:aspartate dehydrogenase